MGFLFKNMRTLKRFVTRRYASTSILREIEERGSLHQVTPPDSRTQLEELLFSGQPHKIFAAIDPVSDSLHIGHLALLVALLRWQRAGHHPVILMGGYTAKIGGDPSNRTEIRPVPSSQHILANTQGIQARISQIFENHQKYFWSRPEPLPPLQFLNNEAWFQNMSLFDLAVHYNHFQVQQLEDRPNFPQRKEWEGSHLGELYFAALRAKDWQELVDHHQCYLQIGGEDQIGNFLIGQDFLSQMGSSVFGLTIPQVPHLIGDKNHLTPVYLEPRHTSPFQLYQYFLTKEDSQVGPHLRAFTFLPVAEIDQLVERHMVEPEKWLGQRTLAEQVTLLVHGEAGLQSAQLSTKVLFQKSIESLGQLGEKELREVFSQNPLTTLTFNPGSRTVLELALAAGCFASKAQAQKLIKAGAFSINYLKEKDPEAPVVKERHILPNNLSLLRVGKKNNFLVKWMMT